ncbi:MAG TPA: 1-phosphofructokinase family hexose kinase [Ilumatobacteraceae bacterium]
MIITVTLNPSLDRTIEIPALDRGEVIRSTGSTVEAGGKGVNVSRALLANGVPSIAVMPLGGADGDELAALLKAEGVEMNVVPVRAATRSNVTLSEPDGTTTKINEIGSPLSGEEINQVEECVLQLARADDWVVLSGRLPAGAADDTYARFVRRLTQQGVKVAVDTSGPALAESIAAGPTLVKPNRDELAEAFGRPITSFADVATAVEALRTRGAGAVLASLGGDGAVLANGKLLAATCSVADRRSTVGAGDCLLAGFLAAGASGTAALLTALQWAAASVALPGSGVPSHAQIASRHPDLITDFEDRGLSTST